MSYEYDCQEQPAAVVCDWCGARCERGDRSYLSWFIYVWHDAVHRARVEKMHRCPACLKKAGLEGKRNDAQYDETGVPTEAA